MHLLKRKAAPLIYHVGIDIGASRVHAATARMTPLGEERVEPFPLGNSRVDMPALMSVAPDGDLEFGDAAAARGADQPETLVSSIRARVGSAVPFVVGDHRISADDAYARLAATVVARPWPPRREVQRATSS